MYRSCKCLVIRNIDGDTKYKIKSAKITAFNNYRTCICAVMDKIYFRYCYLRERAKSHRDETKFDLEMLEAQLDHKAREKHKDTDVKVTIAFIESIVRRQTAWIDQRRKHMEAVFVAHTLEAVARAFEQRANMLSMLGAHQRYEIEQSVRELKRKS